jgi:two-component system sensor histidine kinase BaeS
MKSVVFKITVAVSLFVLIAVFAMAYISGHRMTQEFEEYMNESAVLDDPYPMLERGVVVTGPAEKNFVDGMYIELAWIGAAVMLAAFVASFFIARGLTIPIRKLTKGVMEIAKGNLGYRVKVRAGGEIGMLAKFFNSMAEELARAQFLRKQFFADAAHELKTPIAVIKGNLEAMQDGVIPTSKEAIASLMEETEFLNSMIGDIKYLALADSGQLTLSKKNADINEIVRSCIARLKVAADARNLSLAVDFKDDPLVASIDAERLEQVIYNLLINAGKYTPNGGSVGVVTEKVSDKGAWFAKVTVWDTGQGISAEDIPFIFERFYRVDKSHSKKTGGFGLGLAIVKKMVELHGGVISVESTLGKGSSFFFVVPI